MSRPRIAIPIPTSTDLAYNGRSWSSYAHSVERSGGEAVPVELGLSRSQSLMVAKSCHGICLPGSPADVDPALYGEERDTATAKPDSARYGLDLLLLDHAAESGKPVLAICFGLQSLNTWRGGSLVQDLSPLPVNHSAGGSVAVAHTTVVAKESFLASLLEISEAMDDGQFRRLPVNSSHHQAVASPGTGLKIVARSPEDGVIEALEAEPDGALATAHGQRQSALLIGVQWHPERSYDISAASRALFAWLVSTAAARGQMATELAQTSAIEAQA